MHHNSMQSWSADPGKMQYVTQWADTVFSRSASAVLQQAEQAEPEIVLLDLDFESETPSNQKPKPKQLLFPAGWPAGLQIVGLSPVLKEGFLLIFVPLVQVSLGFRGVIEVAITLYWWHLISCFIWNGALDSSDVFIS